MPQTRPRHQPGFTLIELLVTIAIVGILMAAGIVAFSNTQRISRDAKRRADLDAIAKALEQYYQNTGQYPRNPAYFSTDANWGTTFPGGVWTNSFASGVPPVDPLNTTTYAYRLSGLEPNVGWVTDKSTRFCVQARLEVANGNCSGTDFGGDRWGYCNFVPAGTGQYHCVQNRQ